MDRIFVDHSWSFRECVFKMRTLKAQYQVVLMSFSFTKNSHEETKFIRETRKTIYSLPYDEWKKDKIWEYMNDDMEYIDLMCIR